MQAPTGVGEDKKELKSLPAPFGPASAEGGELPFNARGSAPWLLFLSSLFLDFSRPAS